MAYSKQTWTDDVSAVTGARMTHIEQGIYDNSLATDIINPSGTATTTAEIEEGQITDVIGFKSLKLKGQTSQYTTTGKNKLAIKQLTTQTINGVTFTPHYTGNKLDYVNVNGTATATAGYFLDNADVDNVSTYTNELPSGTYILDDFSGSSTVNIAIFFRYYISGSTFTTINSVENSRKLTINSTFKYTSYIRINNGTTVNNMKFYPQLETGSTQTTYEPYTNGASPNPDFPQQVENVTGYNAIEISNVNKLPYAQSGSQVVSGMTHTSNGKGTYTLNGTATANSRYDWEIEPYTIKQGDYLYLGNTATNSTVTVALLENASTQIMYTGPTAVNRIVSLNNYVGRTVTYIRTYTNAQTLTNFVLKPMICTTTSVSAFEEHRGNNFEINLGTIELCKIGTYQDYIFKRDGKWYKHKEVGKVVWNGTENWQNNAGISTTYVIARPTDLAQANNNVFYNYFSTVADLSVATEGARIGSSINLKNPNTADLASFKTWLGTNNVEMYYQSNTPIEEEITYTPLIRQLDELYNSGLYDVTNISQDNSSEAFILDIEACKNNINGIVEYIRR